MPATFTARQGEYLAFIHSYTTKLGVAPSFDDIARHFGTAPPNVNGMIKTLERRGLLSRIPGAARTLRVLVPATELPGSDFDSRARRARKPTPSVQDVAVGTAQAVLNVVLPRLPHRTRRSSGAQIIAEAVGAVREVLDHLGIEEHLATEVSRRLTAEEGARGERDGRRS